MQFEDRTICITGGSRGIGRALCEEFAHRRADSIVVTGRTSGDLPEKIGSTLVNFITADLAEPDGAATLANVILAEHGDCSILVNVCCAKPFKHRSGLDA